MAVANNLVKARVQKEVEWYEVRDLIPRAPPTHTHTHKQDEEETKMWSKTLNNNNNNTLFETAKAELQADTQTSAMGWADLVLLAQISSQS